jgi:propionate CoA-transferase
VEKVIARRAAMELKRGMTANLGFGISAMVPRILLEEGHAQAVTWAIEQGAVGGMPLTGFAFGCASNADAFVPSPNQFTYFQGGGFDMSFLSFLEVDVDGNVNVSKLGKKPYLTAGCGGFVDITAHAKKIVFSGYFEAGAQLDLTEDGPACRDPRQVHQDGRRGGACNLRGPAGAEGRAGGALCHRALRDAADRNRAGRDGDHAGDRARA